MKKTKLIFMGVVFSLLVTGGMVQAGHNYEGYNKDVGAYNGSAWSIYQRHTGLNGTELITVQHKTTSGDYTVDIRAQRNTGANVYTAWARNIGDNRFITFDRHPILQSINAYHRLEFSNDLTTPVKVNVVGSFKTW